MGGIKSATTKDLRPVVGGHADTSGSKDAGSVVESVVDGGGLPGSTAAAKLLTVQPATTAPVFAMSVPGAQSAPASPAEPQRLAANRIWDAVPAPPTPKEERATLLHLAGLLQDDPIELSGVLVDARRLRAAAGRPDPHLTRALREELGVPVRVPDLLYFLDDVVAARQKGQAPGVQVTAGEARRCGILVHPDEAFLHKPRTYGGPDARVEISPPRTPHIVAPPAGQEFLGPAWTKEYPNPRGETEMMAALAAENAVRSKDPHPDPKDLYAGRVGELVRQLRSQGIAVEIVSTIRRRERGYLMWGAFLLSSATSEKDLDAKVALLEARNQQWGLEIPIQWRHPDGWEATRLAAMAMREEYDVVYATENGAKSSNHYDGEGVDLSAPALPRQVTLTAPDGVTATFDLSDPDEPRDLNLTPCLVNWINEHFEIEKLRGDYPHWDDARRIR
jgi:hypothetical protein